MDHADLLASNRVNFVLISVYELIIDFIVKNRLSLNKEIHCLDGTIKALRQAG